MATRCEISQTVYLSLGYLMIYRISHLRRLKKVSRNNFRYLPFFRPLPNGIEVSALVLGVEVDIGLGFLVTRLEPYLAQHADVDAAH